MSNRNKKITSSVRMRVTALEVILPGGDPTFVDIHRRQSTVIIITQALI